MRRLLLALALAAAAAAASASAADPSPAAGRWKLRLPQGDDTLTLLLAFTETDGKWAGDYIAASARLKKEPTVSKLEVADRAVKFTLLFDGREFLSFDGVLAKDGKKLSGSLAQFGGPLSLTELYPSQLKKLDDPVDLARETLAQVEAGPELFNAGFAVLGQAAAKKVPADEVRQVTDKLARAAAGYGPRWEAATTVRLAGLLADQAGYADIAVAQARRAERMLTDAAPLADQMTVASTLARALTLAGKADEATKYAAQLQKLEARDYAEYQKTAFAPAKFAGRKAMSNRVAVVEVFTGAECPPCVAVDLATDGLLKAYTPAEVLVLNYHFHVPAPDPLTSPDGLDRVIAYGDKITGAPAVFVNGKPGLEGGGPAAAAKAKYDELTKVVDAQLATPAAVEVTLTTGPTAGTGVGIFSATAAVKNAPAGKATLRFVLVEEMVRYAGGNGVRYHHNVVRALPGGAKGFPLTKPAAEQAVTIGVADLRTKLAASLDAAAKTEGEFPRPDRPLTLVGLRLVALVQDDATGEILQAASVKLDGK